MAQTPDDRGRDRPVRSAPDEAIPVPVDPVGPGPAGDPPAVTEAGVRACTAMLEAILARPGVLATLPEDVRVGLLVAAGRVARPTPEERRRVERGFRKQRRRAIREGDRTARAGSGIRLARDLEAFVAPPRIEMADRESRPRPRQLSRPQPCYVCKQRFREIHFFYDAMCPRCADFNYEKRFQTAPLHGRTVLITGGRVKIGYQSALKVLRAGARAVVTTRFPHDAALRFAGEEDFGSWADRLEIHGLDLRHTPSVDLFARYLDATLDRLDIQIHNACQTVRRPPGFYRHLMDLEARPVEELPARAAGSLASRERCLAMLGGDGETGAAGSSGDLVTWHDRRIGIGLRRSARLSLVPYEDDNFPASDPFPRGSYDADLQQVDLRITNSWRLTLAEVPTPELLEVHLVNAIAPYVLCGRLKSLMTRDRTDQKHIVNVSAMEGQFSRGTKTDRHPHTNMAKAALNMMTRTSASEYAGHGIFMNAVDTGWVTDEDPAHHAIRKRTELDFQPPLDIVDGAARVCDPFFSGLLSGVHRWGKFFKDYEPTGW